MIEEPISERIRKWIKQSEEEETYMYPSSYGGRELMDDTMYDGGPEYERAFFEALASAIDAEIADIIEAQNDSAHYIIKKYAEEHGKPMEKRENITQWLDHWFIPRPVYEDREAIRFFDDGIAWNDCDENPTDVRCIFDTLDGAGRPIACGGDRIVARANMTKDGRVKRRDKPMLDADGVTINVGDTVYWAEENDENLPWSVIAIEDGKVVVKAGTWTVEDNEPTEFTHKKPDTQEKMLHELLRESVKKNESLDTGLIIMTIDGHSIVMNNDGAQALADEIERSYTLR